MPLADIPEHVQKAFVAAEDKRFFQHKGIDERGVIRAFIGNLAKPGRPQGGSTITQQVAKNLLVGDDVTYERKIREMIVASRLERMPDEARDPRALPQHHLSRPRLLGRRDGGAELFRQDGEGPHARRGRAARRPAEGAELLQPRPLPRARPGAPRLRAEPHARRTARSSADADAAGACGKTDARPRPSSGRGAMPGFYFVDHLNREAKTFAGVDGLTSASYAVRSTINAPLQRATETALQEGLARYELATGRMRFAGAEANLAETIRRLETAPEKPDGAAAGAPEPLWLQALERARLPLYDVHWPAAVVVDKAETRDGEVVRVGLADGRIVPLNAWSAGIRRALKPARRRPRPRQLRPRARAAEAPAPSCGCARWFRARRSCSRTRPGASSPWRAASPTR